MRYINLRLTYLLTYLLTYPLQSRMKLSQGGYKSLFQKIESLSGSSGGENCESYDQVSTSV